MKYCKDCRHYVPDRIEPAAFSRCAFGQADEKVLSLVTGELTQAKKPEKFCDQQRDWVTACGPDAKNFEPAEVVQHA